MSQDLQSRPYTAWQLIRAYWQSEQGLLAYFLLISVIFLSVLLVGMEVVLNYWYNYFYNALQDYDKAGAIDLLRIFVFLAGVFIIFAVYRYYLQQFLGLRWRRWLTNQFLTRWLERKNYYYLENFNENTDNPDQRIQEDIAALVSSSLSLSIGLIGSVTTFIAFIYILWSLSGHFTLHLGYLGTYVIPGYLVWVSIIYAIVGTFCTFKIGYPLVSLNFEQQRREANFRFAAVDLRSHAENVALYHGEVDEKGLLSQLFEKVLNNWYAIILRQKLLLWFTAGYNQVSVLVPLIVVLPNYFNKVFKLGGLMQALRAFQQIQDALSFLINAYTEIAQWRAVVRRLLTFLNHMSEMEERAAEKNKFVYGFNQDNKITISNLTLCTYQGDELLSGINEEFVHGKNYLITGPSGIGKSTFIRTIAGIWPYGSGVINLPPEDKRRLYLSQTAYMPIGTLKEALLFPDKHSTLSDAELIKILNDCDLPELTVRLQDFAMWSQQLSPGELQRIAFARVLIQKPDWVFLDESTSSLDLPHEAALYGLLKTALPTCSMVSVGHRPSITSFHDYQIDLSQYGTGKYPAKKLSPRSRMHKILINKYFSNLFRGG